MKRTTKTYQPDQNVIEAREELRAADVGLEEAASLVTRRIRRVQQLTAEYLDITIEQLICHDRRREWSWPRQIAMFLAREVVNATFSEIAREFGNRHHATVVYAVREVARQSSVPSVLSLRVGTQLAKLGDAA